MRFKVVTNIFQQICLDSTKNESNFLLLAFLCRISLLLRLCLWSGWSHHLMSYVVCLYSDLGVLTNYYQAIRIKACVRYFHQILIFSSNDSPSKTTKNAFYFI